MKVIVYAIASRTGGALSVLSDFYKEITENQSKYQNITWYFLLSTQEFSETQNVKILNFEWSVKSWIHRAYFNLITVNRFIKQKNVTAIVSLQNMRVFGTKIPNIICLHNILPLYNCDKTVLDTVKQRLKQRIVNKSIVNSIKKSYCVMVAADWIKKAIIDKFGINEAKIVVSRLKIAIEEQPRQEKKGTNETIDKLTFFYPAAPFPYKNHKVVLQACSILKKQGIEDYVVEFTFAKKQCKTAKLISKEVIAEKLPICFVGNMPRADVMNSYKNKVLIFSSRIENDAMPLIECMQYGGYVLAADLPYSRDVLEGYHGKEYFLPEDAEVLAEYMKKIILNGIPEVIAPVNTQGIESKSRPEKVVEILWTLEKEHKG